MADDSAWLGVRVVQGPNWSPSNGEYGGEGFVGTVVGMVGAQPGSIDQASSSAASGISIFSGVTVRWDTGATQRYEYGPNSTPDLRILDTAPAGVRHYERVCFECDEVDIAGLCWMCTECTDVYLCSKCYVQAGHVMDHEFRVKAFLDSNGYAVSRRNMERMVKSRGIFKGAVVVPWDEKPSAGEGSSSELSGTVLSISGVADATERSSAVVNWSNGDRDTRLCGHLGRVDIKCVKPGRGRNVYVDHLPPLDRMSLKSFVKASARDDGKVTNRSKQPDREVKNILEGELKPNSHGADVMATLRRLLPNAPGVLNAPAPRKEVTEHVKSDVMSAIVNGQTALVEELLLGYPDLVNLRYQFGNSLVHFAVVSHSVTVIKLLFNYGCSLDVQDERGNTPLMCACAENSMLVVEVLLQHGACTDIAGCLGNRPLHVACGYGHQETTRMLLRHGGDPDCLNDSGNTALFTAIVKDHVEVVKLLLHAGASLDILNADQMNPTQYAVAIHSMQSLAEIVQHVPSELSRQDAQRGLTLLHIAAALNYHDILEMLIDKDGCDIEAVDNKGGTPLTTAAVNGAVACVEILVERGATLDAKRNDGNTALHCALDTIKNMSVSCNLPLVLPTKIAEIYESVRCESAEFKRFFTVVLYLCRRGASLRCLNLCEKSPLDICKNSALNEYLIRNSTSYHNESRAALSKVPSVVPCAVNTFEAGSNTQPSEAGQDGSPAPGQMSSSDAQLDGAAKNILAEDGERQQPKTGCLPKETDQDKDTCQVTKPCVIQAPSTSAHCEDTPNTNAALLQGQVERLEKAIADRDLPRVSDILDKWPEIIDTRFGDSQAHALHLAVQSADLDIIRKLHSCGCSLEVKDTNDNTPLCYAVSRNLDTVISGLLDIGAKLTTPGHLGAFPLHVASYCGHVQACKILLSRGHEVDLMDITGQTPLHRAISRDNPDVVSLLLAAGADVHVSAKGTHCAPLLAIECNVQRSLIVLLQERPELTNMVHIEGGRSCLHYAATFNKPQILEMLLNMPNVDIEVRDKFGNTPLVMAIVSGNANGVEQLIAYGAGLDTTNNCRNSPLHAAIHCYLKHAQGTSNDWIVPGNQITMCTAPKIKEIQNVIQFAKEESCRFAAIACFLAEQGCRLSMQNVSGQKTLHGCEDGSMKALLEHYSAPKGVSSFYRSKMIRNRCPVSTLTCPGPSTSESETDDVSSTQAELNSGSCWVAASGADRSALVTAIYNHDYRVIADCLRRCPELAGQGFDEEHSSLVQLAALSGDAKAVRLLVQLGCDVNQHNKFGIPPSFSALMRNFMEVLECLLELGASVDVCDGDGATLLHKASIEGSGASVEMLIRFRHEVNCFDKLSQTPLHHAASRNLVDIVRLLIDAGASPTVLANHGGSPVESAAINNATLSLQVMFRSLPYTVNFKSSNLGETLLHRAAQAGALDALELILDQPETDINAVDLLGRSALVHAILKGSRVIVNHLVRCGVRLQPAECDRMYDPLSIALATHKAIVDGGNNHISLLNISAERPDFSSRIDEIQTAMPYATEQRNRLAAIACFLAEQGCNPSSLTSQGTPIAAHCVDDQMKELLESHFVQASSRTVHGTLFPRCMSAVRSAMAVPFTNDYPSANEDVVNSTPALQPQTPSTHPASDTSNVVVRTDDTYATTATETSETTGSNCSVQTCSNVATVTFHPCGHTVTCRGCCFLFNMCCRCWARVEKRMWGEVEVQCEMQDFAVRSQNSSRTVGRKSNDSIETAHLPEMLNDLNMVVGVHGCVPSSDERSCIADIPD